MPIFNDKGNERLAISLTAILLFTLFIFLGYQIGCKKSTVKIEGVEVVPNQMKENVKEKAGEFKEQIDTMKKLSNEELPRVLKDSIATLLYIRQKDLNQAESLLNGFEGFNGMPPSEQQSFLQDVYDFLSKSKNPNRYIDFGIVAKELITKNRIDILTADNINKDRRIEELQKKINKLEKDKTEIEELYTKALEIIEQNKREIEVLRKDSTANAELIATLNIQIETLQEAKSRLEHEMENYNPIRIQNCIFTAPNCKMRKDRTYTARCINSIQIKFVVSYNIPSDKNAETVKVVFTLPTRDPRSTIIKEEKQVKVIIGQEKEVIFKKQGYDFIPGLYTAQIFYEEFSLTIPIEIKSLVAK